MIKVKKKKYSSGEDQVSLVYFWWISLRIFFRKNIIERFRKFKARRPHSSFKLTKRRDFKRPVKLPGYWSFSKKTLKLIFENKKIFGALILLVVFFGVVFVGLLDQKFISSLQSVVDVTGDGTFEGAWGELGKAGLIATSIFTSGGMIQSPTDIQKFAIGVVAVIVWLAVIQICRNVLAGHKKFKLREVLYSCGAPIVPTFIIVTVILLQLIPAFIAIIISSAAQLTQFANNGGIEYMVFAMVVLLLSSVSIFWVMGSLFALIIVTIQGTYPLKALKIAGDMVSQRRLMIFRRILFLAFLVFSVWIIVMIPLILLMNWASGFTDFFEVIPLVQIVMLFLSSASLVFSTTYIYLLYRGIVDHDRKN